MGLRDYTFLAYRVVVPFAMSRAAGCPATSGEPKRLVRGGTSSGISTPHRLLPAS
jgi:hypothetical protein